MTTSALAFALGVICAALAWLAVRQIFEHPLLVRVNFRGSPVATGGGIVMVLALLPGWAGTALLAAETGGDMVSTELVASFGIAGLAGLVALIGLVDDLLAAGDEKGFRGHLGAAARGRLTTGGIKLAAGGAVAVAVTAGGGPLWQSLVDAGVVALAMNLANLFDRAPGRVTKVALAALAALLLAAGGLERHQVAAAALVVGTAGGMLLPELREKVMLGDTGANVLGAVLGLTAVRTTSSGTALCLLVALLALNLLSEKVSFSRIIEGAAPLRWLDRLGRSRP